jgi:hypothetical protein
MMNSVGLDSTFYPQKRVAVGVLIILRGIEQYPSDYLALIDSGDYRRRWVPLHCFT